MKAAEVWTLLLGAVVALAGTLVAQWSSLAYQTRRQREARRADFQRTTLIQVRDLLLELSEAMGRVAAARYVDQDWIKRIPTDHPTVAAARSIADRLVIIAVAVEDQQLRIHVDQVARRAHFDAIALTHDKALEATEEARAKSLEIHEKAVQLLGEQLRKLP
jgi:hypothetical protein